MPVKYLYIFNLFILIYVCELKFYSPNLLCSMANSLTKPFIYFIILVVVAIYQYGHCHIIFIIIIPILNLKSVFDVYPEDNKRSQEPAETFSQLHYFKLHVLQSDWCPVPINRDKQRWTLYCTSNSKPRL